VADGLSSLLKQGVDTNAIQPVKVCRRAPGVSHLLFADDTVLFFKASQQQAARVNDIIDAYATATGQLINRAKCSIFFGSICPDLIQHEMKQLLQVQAGEFEEKYL
jgi:hypothetical protein